jgi:hypothetical protein
VMRWLAGWLAGTCASRGDSSNLQVPALRVETSTAVRVSIRYSCRCLMNRLHGHGFVCVSSSRRLPEADDVPFLHKRVPGRYTIPCLVVR